MQLLLDDSAVWSRRVLRLLEECLERQQQADQEANAEAEAEEVEEETQMLVESPSRMLAESRTPIASPSRDQIRSRARAESEMSEPDMLQESPSSANQTLGKPWWKRLACCMKSAQATPYSSVDFLNTTGEDTLEPQTPPSMPKQHVQVSTLIGGARSNKIDLGAPTGVARPVAPVAPKLSGSLALAHCLSTSASLPLARCLFTSLPLAHCLFTSGSLPLALCLCPYLCACAPSSTCLPLAVPLCA